MKLVFSKKFIKILKKKGLVDTYLSFSNQLYITSWIFYFAILICSSVPSRARIGSTTTASIITPEFEAFDTVIATMTDRFEQEGYQIYSKNENDLDELNLVLWGMILRRKLYWHNFIVFILIVQFMRMLQCIIIPVIKNMSCGEKLLFEEVIKLIRMMLVHFLQPMV